MASNATLTTFRTRIRNLLQDTGAIAWSNDTLDTSISIALHHLSVFKPRIKYRDFIPAANFIDLSTYGDVINIRHIYYPYDVHGYPIKKIDGLFTLEDGVPYLYVNCEVDDTSTIRVETIIPHTLNGLDSATSTSFTSHEESLLILGSAGYACLSRSIALNETSVSRTTSTPNYGTLSEVLLKRFENGFYMEKSAS